jgi:CO/xanthine dehydrogenase Mo-binding subunit
VWDGRSSQGDGSHDSGFTLSGWASAIVEGERDPVEYLPRIRGVWLSVDGGKIISEDRARRSLKLSAIQALGWAYREQIKYIQGIIFPDQFEDFDILAFREIPPVNIDFIQSAREDPAGIGDLPFSCIPAAYLEAVSQAADYHLCSIPLRTQDVWYAEMEKRNQEALA